MLITWDERKRIANLDKHGMDFANVTLSFFETASIVPSRRNRHVAVGRLAGPTTVIFAALGTEAISIISMRAASKKERNLL